MDVEPDLMEAYFESNGFLVRQAGKPESQINRKKQEALYRCCGGQTEDQTWAGAAPCGKLRDCNPASRRAGHGGAYWR